MKKTIKIKLLDNVFCKSLDKKALDSVLSFQSSFWKPGPFSMKRKASVKYAIDRRSGNFLSGLLPRIQTKFNIELSGYQPDKITFGKPNLKGVTLRDYQERITIEATAAGRGVIDSPTGTGKTLMSAAIVSAAPKTAVTLFLCDTIDLLNQTVSKYREYGITKIAKIGGGSKFDSELMKKSSVTVSTIQSFRDIDPKLVVDLFDIVIVDECHACADQTKSYGTVLQSLNCWNKFGLTATVPKDKGKLLALEGLIGPVVAKYDTASGIKEGNMAQPKVTLIPVKYNENLAALRTYKDIYNKCVVNNLFRNNCIIQEALKRANKSLSVLIIVREIQHGNNLLAIAKRIKVPVKFVYGNIPGNVRNDIKKALDSKKIKIGICTDVWTQGIDIPSLDCALNARGGKSRRETLQFVGRGTRTTDIKKELEIIEILDPYRYLAEHLVIRLSYYAEKGWT